MCRPDIILSISVTELNKSAPCTSFGGGKRAVLSLVMTDMGGITHMHLFMLNVSFHTGRQRGVMAEAQTWKAGGLGHLQLCLWASAYFTVM